MLRSSHLPRRQRECALQREHSLRGDAKFLRVVGLDESGVGSIAGPVVAAAVHLSEEFDFPAHAPHIADAKSLGRAARQQAFDILNTASGFHWGAAAMPASTVDAIGATPASEAAMKLAAERLERRLLRSPSRLPVSPTFLYLADGITVPNGLDGEAIVRGDQFEACIAAASVVAASVHSASMAALARRWPLWELDVNHGWPSRTHLRSLVAHGPSGCHRRSVFPFQRRHGRRIGFHPDRSAYSSIQEELRVARESLRLLPFEQLSYPAAEGEDDEPVRVAKEWPGNGQ